MLSSLLGLTWCLNGIHVLLLSRIFWKMYPSMYMNEIYVGIFLRKLFINYIWGRWLICVYAKPCALYSLPKLQNNLIIWFILANSAYRNTDVCLRVAKHRKLPFVHMHVCRKTFKLVFLCCGEQNSYSTALFSNFESVMI